MIKGTPYGFEDEVVEAPNGWAAWKNGCPTCAFRDEEDPPMALVCPTCEEPRCDDCMPAGRGCECLSCEEGGMDDD